MGWIALLDACVLFPSGTRDLLLRAAERDLYQVRWSPDIIEEVRRNLVHNQRCSKAQADSMIKDMQEAFPDATVTGYEDLAPAMRNTPDDRHVLAAAVVAGADVIVTDNTRHFPVDICDSYGIEVQTADEFLAYSFDLAPDVMASVFLQQVDDFTRPAWSAADALATLDTRVPIFASRLRGTPMIAQRLSGG